MAGSIVSRLCFAALVALATGVMAAPAAAAPAVSGEFKLATPIETNTKIAAGPDGNIWVNLSGPEKDVARITPAGAVTEFDLGAGIEGTSGVAAGPDGNLWVTRKEGVNRFSPADPEGTSTPFELSEIKDNSPIVAGPDGNLWVATKDAILRIPPANPAGKTSFAFVGLTPTDIDATPNQLVIADAGTVKRILAVGTAGNKLGEFGVGGSPQGVAGNPNDSAAFTQPVMQPKEMGVLSPTAPPLVVPISSGLDPFGIALGADGAYWSAERNSDGLLRMTASGEITPLTGFSAGSEPRQITAGPGNTLWVTLPGGGVNSVGRVSGLEPPALPLPLATAVSRPRTTIKSGPKGRLTTRQRVRAVRFGFASPDTVTRFECRLRKLSPRRAKKRAAGSLSAAKGKGKGKARVPKFKPCASPKGYKVRPGRYRFEVRGVNAAGVDETPATRSFRVVRVAK